MICEMTIGRKTRLNAYGAYKRLQLRRSIISDVIAGGLILGGICLLCTKSYGFGAVSLIAGLLILKFQFAAFGLLAIFGALVILSYYAVVGGWIIDYTFRSFCGELNYNTVDEAGAAFGLFTETPWRVIVCFLVFMVLCGAMLIGGVRKGIEKWSKILMPLLFILLLAVIARSVTLPGAWRGVEFFLHPDFSKLTASGVLEALGHCFYSLSLGMGITVTYGSYMKKEQNIFSASIWVMVLDTLAAILAGLAIFPAVFAMGFDPGVGPSLIFNILPATFNRFPGGTGWIWAGLFFLMLSIGAITSGVALLQNGVSFFMDELKWGRYKSIAVAHPGGSGGGGGDLRREECAEQLFRHAGLSDVQLDAADRRGGDLPVHRMGVGVAQGGKRAADRIGEGVSGCESDYALVRVPRRAALPDVAQPRADAAVALVDHHPLFCSGGDFHYFPARGRSGRRFLSRRTGPDRFFESS